MPVGAPNNRAVLAGLRRSPKHATEGGDLFGGLVVPSHPVPERLLVGF